MQQLLLHQVELPHQEVTLLCCRHGGLLSLVAAAGPRPSVVVHRLRGGEAEGVIGGGRFLEEQRLIVFLLEERRTTFFLLAHVVQLDQTLLDIAELFLKDVPLLFDRLELLSQGVPFHGNLQGISLRLDERLNIFCRRALAQLCQGRAQVLNLLLPDLSLPPQLFHLPSQGNNFPGRLQSMMLRLRVGVRHGLALIRQRRPHLRALHRRDHGGDGVASHLGLELQAHGDLVSQHLHAEWLAHVVRGPLAVALSRGGLVRRPGRNHNDRHAQMGVRHFAADLLADLETRHAWHLDIQEHNVR
mmetsp:Transcript_150330/g.483110  ORF Transcript_150330/g.483110 Transcript_150330/m.483110 type:complete len:301 (-) Transcript_150330:321-1223(-)